MKIDLEFWLGVYDKSSFEMEQLIQSSNWINEYVGRPFHEDILKKLREIDDEYHKMRDIEQYARKRILKYNR